MNSTIFIAMGLFFMLMVATKGQFGLNAKTLFVSMFSVVGLAGLGVSAYRLPRWRTEREGQMAAIATRAVRRATAQPATAPQTLDASPQLDLDLETDLTETLHTQVPHRTRS
jgi:hypothetical protein